MRRQPNKRRFLSAAGAWNSRARRVDSPLFAQSDFFDPCDKVQVKYEMLRAHAVDELNVTAASRLFGYSRESFYAAMEALLSQGIVELADGKRGPKQPSKLTPEVQQFLLRQIDDEPSVSSRELAERLAEQLDIQVHRRSIERFRRSRGKKKRRRRPARR